MKRKLQANEQAKSTVHFDKNDAWAKRRTNNDGAEANRNEGFSFSFAP
jgi:hypothetical protein